MQKDNNHLEFLKLSLNNHRHDFELFKWSIGAAGLPVFLIVTKIELFKKADPVLTIFTIGVFLFSAFCGFSALTEQDPVERKYLSAIKRRIIAKSTVKPNKQHGVASILLCYYALMIGYLLFFGLLVIYLFVEV